MFFSVTGKIHFLMKFSLVSDIVFLFPSPFPWGLNNSAANTHLGKSKVNLILDGFFYMNSDCLCTGGGRQEAKMQEKPLGRSEAQT